MTQTDYKNKNVAVLGLGIEGKDLVKFLLDKGAIVTVYDEKPQSELDIEGIKKDSVSWVTGPNCLANGLKEFKYIFRSPGIYPYRREIIEAVKSGVQVSSATKLFFDLCPAIIIGVTGTKGKGTTSSLIYNILKTDGKDAYLAGNIGKPLLELLPSLTDKAFVVLELSSFQLIDLTKSPHVSVVLNITTDHLDWHKNRNEYVEAKTNIVKGQFTSDYAVINADYEDSNKFSLIGQSKKYFFSTKKQVEGSYVASEHLCLKIGANIADMGDTKGLLLRGKHNWENVLAAICTAGILRISNESIKKAIFSFRGLEHRLELVGEVNKVKYYNDSFATGPDSVIAAIKSCNEPTTLILGGYDKKLDYKEMVAQIKLSKNLKNIILIGQIADKLEELIKLGEVKAKVVNMGMATMLEIVKKCYEITKKNEVVLLSPGSSSFDMFVSYKDRGNQFKDAVNSLPKE